MGGEPRASSIWRFGVFEMEGRTAELRRNGICIKLQEQPAQLLLFLLEHAGEIVTREDLRQKLWEADTFVDFDHALNTAIMKLREALGDARDRPVYIQTIPRKGYRFVAPVAELPAVENTPSESRFKTGSELPVMEPPGDAGDGRVDGADSVVETAEARTAGGLTGKKPPKRVTPGLSGELDRRPPPLLILAVMLGALLLLAAAGSRLYRSRDGPVSRTRSLTRLTFDEGLQTDPTWSPDGRYLAYSSDKGGTTNIWVQQISGGDPIQVTRGPGPNWQPNWSPDGRFIAYRSEAGGGGIFIIPALGGAGQERRIASFGYAPRWSPDGSQVLFHSGPPGWSGVGSFSVVGVDGGVPRKALVDFFEAHGEIGETSATWHPDGRRVTVWADNSLRPGPSPNFWTIPLDGGEAVHTHIPPDIERKFEELTIQGGYEWVVDAKFTWAPAGDALFLERTFRGARSLWRLAINPKSLAATGLERLTTGVSLDTAPAISPDGKRLAFTAASGQISAWIFPLDANHGRIGGGGRPVTSAGLDVWLTAITRDGSKLAFSGIRSGEQRLWVKSLPDGPEAPLFFDSSLRNMSEWSPDGRYLAYRRTQQTSESQIMLWSEETRQERPLTSPDLSAQTQTDIVYDWSPDGKTVLMTRAIRVGGARDPRYQPLGAFRDVAAWTLPVASAPHAESGEKRIISDPLYEIYQEHFSPDGEWIAFEAVKKDSEGPAGGELSSLYVMRATGGPWIALVDERAWADKPRWSPDGRMIYFLSNRGSFFNVWAIHLDPRSGQPIGAPFAVTTLESPSLAVPAHIEAEEISVSDNALVLTLEKVTGGIWVLDNVDR